MRKVLITVIVLLAMSGIASATGWQEVPCDSTSYYYYFQFSDNQTSRFQPFWEQPCGLMPEPEENSRAKSETVAKDTCPASKDAAEPLFSLPEGFLQRPNPDYMVVKRDRQEFYAHLPADYTSPVYTCKNLRNLCLADSLSMFLPFNTRNLSDYTVKQFGIKARFVEIRNPLPPHFHIDMNSSPIREKYPWMVIFPAAISVLLVLLAFYSQDGYIRMIFNAVFYHNAFLQRMRERNVNADKSGILLLANYLINAALLAMVALYRYNYQFSSPFFLALATMLLILVLVYLAKRVASLALASLFGCRDVFSLYYRSVSYTVQALGVFLLALNMLSLYVNRQGLHDFFFYATLSGCAVAEFMKIFRLFKIIIDKHFSYFYLFLYLCAVEFLPVLLVVRKLSL